VFVYPQTAVSRFESFPGLKGDYSVRLSPGAVMPKPLVLANNQPSSVSVRNESARPVVGMVFVKTLKGALMSAIATRPLDPAQVTENRPLPISPVSPGSYLVEVSESGVLYLIGQVVLPGRLNLVVHRNRPRLTVKLHAPADAPHPDTPLHLAIMTPLGEAVGRLELPGAHTTELGGLEAGPYRIEAGWGGHRALGWVQVGSPGSPNVLLELRLR
jgi:hypothetical protein